MPDATLIMIFISQVFLPIAQWVGTFFGAFAIVVFVIFKLEEQLS